MLDYFRSADEESRFFRFHTEPEAQVYSIMHSILDLEPIDINDFLWRSEEKITLRKINNKLLLLGIFPHGKQAILLDPHGVEQRKLDMSTLLQLSPEYFARWASGYIVKRHTISKQSGYESKDFAESKNRKKWANNKKLRKKMKQVSEDLQDANLGSTKSNTKRNFYKKAKTKHVFIKPQSGVDASHLCSMIEKLGGVFLLKYTDKPLYSALSALLLLFQGSLTVSIINVIKSVFSHLKTEECTLGAFLDWCKSLVNNVDKFKNNRFATSFMRLLTKAYSTFLSPDIAAYFGRINDNEIVSKVMSIFSGTSNPIESLLHAVTYLTNGVDVFVKTGELTGFLHTEMMGEVLMEDMHGIRQDFLLYKNGDIGFIRGHKQYNLFSRLDAFEANLREYKKSKKGPELKQLDDWQKELDSMLILIKKTEAQASARIQPYHFILTAGSGISKTYLMKLLCNSIAIKNGIPYGREFTYYLCQANKFQSGWKNHNTIIIVDDSAAMHASNNNNLDLADWTLRSANNAVQELLGADITEKGVLFNRSLIEGWTSNSFNQQFEAYARFPSAIHRRFQLHLVGRVRPQYTKSVTAKDVGMVSSQIDYSKLSPKQRGDIAPDAWIFDCYECEIIDTPREIKTSFGAEVQEADNLYRFVVPKWNGEEMSGLSLEAMISFLCEHSFAHFENQAKVLEMDTKVYDIKNYCSHGMPLSLSCTCCAKEKRATLLREVKIKHTKYKKFTPILKEPTAAIVNEYFSCNPKDISYRDYYMFMLRRDLPKLIPGKDYGFHKDLLIKTGKVYTFRDTENRRQYQQYITTVKERELVPEDPLGLFASGLYFSRQSGKESPRVMYMRGLLDIILEGKIKHIPQRFKEMKNSIEWYKLIITAFLGMLKTWFDEMVCDVFDFILQKCLKVIENILKAPTHYIPTIIEGTALGAYAHIKHPIYKVPLALDWLNYKNDVFKQWVVNPNLVHAVRPNYEITNFVYEKFMRSKTCIDRIQERAKKPLSFTQFAMKAGFMISDNEKAIKMDNPSFFRDMVIPAYGAGIVITCFIPSLCRSFKDMYVETQMGYEVKVDEIAKLDADTTAKWYAARKEVMRSPITTANKIVYSELENLIIKNIFYCKILDTNEFDSVFSFANKYVICAHHFARKAIGKVLRFTKVEIPNEECPGNAYVEFCLSEKNIYKLNGDLCVIYTEKYMDHMRTKNLVDYLPETPSTDIMNGKLYWKNRLGAIQTGDATNIDFRRKCSNDEKLPDFEGYYYKGKNFSGLCGAVLLDHTHKGSQILGIHVGGNEENEIGLACTITRSQVEAAMSFFEPLGVVKQSSLDKLDRFGVRIHNYEVYKKSAFLDTVDRLDGVELLGSVPNRISPQAKVVMTPIADDIRRRFKLSVQWGPAPFHYGGDKRHGPRNLIKAYSTKSTLKRLDLLERASIDYTTRIMTPYRENKEFWKEELRVLNEFEVVNGVIGKKFLGGMNMSTAFGAHRAGPKSKYARQEDNVWIFDEDVMEEFRRVLNCYKEGVYLPELAVAMLKNEATEQRKIDIGKTRFFYMASTIIQMIIRMYLLTSTRYWCLNCEHTECAVGINPHSDDWDKFTKCITKYKAYIALDLVNCDLASLFEVVSTAVDIFYKPILESGNLAEEDKKVLACIKQLIIYCICDVNGDLVVLHGIIPSGTPLTSMLGCIVNSLNFRMAFYYYYPKTPLLFNDVAVLRTYGDDSAAGVSQWYPKLSIKSILAAWEDIGIHGTDIHKNKVSTTIYYKLEELEFLKRKMVYNKDFGQYVAPLNVDSMFKSLSCHVPTKSISMSELTGQCVDNFLLEAKFHGRKFYESSREILCDVMHQHDLSRFCRTLDISYDKAVEIWKENLHGPPKVTSYDDYSQVEIIRRGGFVLND